MKVRALETLFYRNVLRNRGDMFEFYGDKQEMPPSMTTDIESEVPPVSADRFGMPVVPAPKGKADVSYAAAQAATQETVDGGTGKSSKHK